MSFDGNGNYTQPVGTVAVSNTVIDSTKFNALIQDLMTALSSVLVRDGQAPMLANLGMGGNRVSGSADGSADQDLATIKQVRLATVAVAKQLDGTAQIKTVYGAPASISIQPETVFTPGSFMCQSTGTGDTNLAGLSFVTPTCSLKMGLRADGVFIIGGSNRIPYSLYTDPASNLVAAGDVVAYSDPRLKENFQQIVRPLESLMKLNGMRFTWKHGIPHTQAKGGEKDIGFMSDNVASVLPEAVKKSIDISGEAYDVVAYHKVIPLIVEAMKEQQDMIDALREQIAHLKGQTP